MDINTLLNQSGTSTTATSAATQPKEEFSYDIFLQSLKDAHLGTTRNNFEERANALSDDFKAMIQNSFDCEQDYVLQQKIASLYSESTTAITSQNFLSSVRKMGLTVNVTWAHSTSYIKENGTYVDDGRIGVYTISDNEGGEIVIVDANGNGFLETEEIFLNQILEGISTDIVSGEFANRTVSSPQNTNYADGGSYSGSTGSESGSASGRTASIHDDTDTSERARSMSQGEYDRLVDYYVENENMTLKTAIDFVNSKYNLEAGIMSYSGEYATAVV